MIFIGPEEDSSTIATPLPDSMPVGTLLRRVAAELDDLDRLLRKLETAVFPTDEADVQLADRQALQSIDLLGQSLQALSQFLASLSHDCAEATVPVALPLARIPLADLRYRLAMSVLPELCGEDR